MTEKITVRLSEVDALRMLADVLRPTLSATRTSDVELEVVIDPANTSSICDVGIVIALKEEFAELFPQLTCEHVFKKNVSQHYYIFDRASNGSNYRCVVTFIGGMGLSKAAIVGDRVIQEFSPHTIVNIGIAGSMDMDAVVGDIVVAEQSDEYLASSKAISKRTARRQKRAAGRQKRVAGRQKVQQGFEYRLSGDPYKTTDALVKHADNMAFAHKNAYVSMMMECRTRKENLLGTADASRLEKKGIVRAEPSIITGRIASGPTVGATEFFVDWLKEVRDRKYIALEMELAGVLASAHSRGTDTLIIRGISDYSDERKKHIEKISGGALRRYAMNNAIALLWRYLDLGLLGKSK